MGKNVVKAEQQELAPVNLMEGAGWDILDSVDEVELPRIRISRETKQFLVDGEEDPVKRIKGRILHVENVRVFWHESFEDSGGGQAPDCASIGGIVPNLGDDRQAESCAECKQNEWGSKGDGKACSQKKRMLFLMDGKSLPHVMDIPSLGLKAVNLFARDYRANPKHPHVAMALIEISLREKKSKGGGEGTEPVFKILDAPEITPANMEEFQPLAKELMGLIDTFGPKVRQANFDDEVPF